jgi:hypothetical protein
VTLRPLVLAAALLGAAPAGAEVISSGPNGFELREQIQMVVPPAVAYAAFGRIGGWWSPAHSYSGKAANLSLSLVPGGCFCERLDNGGGVEHMRVAHTDPGKRIILTGALGPLLTEAVTAVMDVEVTRVAGGSRLVMTYRATGFARGNAATLAPAVDAVLGEQIGRLRSYAVASNRQTGAP